MPRITEARRAARYAHILEAAWTCFDRGGLQGTTMEDIIRASGLSAGAVYGYFTGKDDLIEAAVTRILSELGQALAPVWGEVGPADPAEMVGRTTDIIRRFADRGAYNLLRIAVHGWSEAQRNERLRTVVQGAYLGLRGRLKTAAERWRAAGTIDPAADTEALAETIFSLILGFIAQSVLLGDATPAAHAAGVHGLIAGAASPPGKKSRGHAEGTTRKESSS